MTLFSRLRNSFFTGMAIIVPIFVTIVIMRFFILKINNAMLAPISSIFQPYIETKYLLYIVRVGVFLAIILLISLIGMLTKIILFTRFFGFWERILIKLPVANTIYTTIRQISILLLEKNKGFLKQPVLVEYPRKGIYSIGFLTSSKTSEKIINVLPEGEDFVHIYIATSPNPTSGMFLIVRREDIRELDISVEQATKLVISGGAILPEEMVRKLQANGKSK